MNKFLQKLAKIFLGLSMAAGVGVAIGAGKNGTGRVDATESEYYTYTFTAKQFSDGSTAKTLGDITWTPTTSWSVGTGYWGYDATKGQQWGSGSHTLNTLTLTAGTSVSNVSSVEVSASIASSGGCSLSVMVGSTSFKYSNATSVSLTTTNTAYKFTNTSTVSGAVKISLSNGSKKKAQYIKTITINTDSGSGGDDLEQLDAPTLSLSGTVVSWTNITGNNGYTYSITGTESKSGSLAANTTSLDVSTLSLAYGSYSITVTAKGDGTTTSDSNASSAQAFTLSEPTVSGTFNLYSGDIVEGDYVVYYNGYALKSAIASNRFENGSVTPSNNAITNPGVSLVWHIAANGDYWTLYNDSVSKYAGGTTTKNQGALLASVTDYAKWTVTGSSTYEFENYGRANGQSDTGNKWLRNNGSNGWACYSTSTGNAVSLYKKYVAYTVQYNPVSDSGTGTGTMANSTTTVSACTFTAPSGKEFDHWNTQADDNGTTYAVGASVTSSCTLYAIWRNLVPSVALSTESVELTAGGSSSSVTATPTNIDSPTYSWSRTSGDDCVTLTNTSTNAVTIAPNSNTFATCTLTLTVNGTLGGSAITPIQKTVSVSINKVPSQANPYTVAEAIYAIDNNKTKTNVYVSGIVCQVDSFSNGAITYWISDDGTTTNKFEVYQGKDASGASFSDINDVLVDDEVLIYGSITLYNSSVHEFSSGSQRVSYSRVTISSIAIKTAPKTAYVPGSAFDPSSLEITVTYSNSDTEDVAYSGNEAKFSFDVSTVSSNCTVTITYGGVTCTQALTVLTVKNVTSVASSPTEVYQGDPIPGSDVTLNVLYSDDVSTGTVQADSVSVDTTSITTHVLATATYNAATGTKTATFYVDVVKKPVWDYVDDVIDNAETTPYLGSTGTSTWGSDFELDFSSGSKYTIHSMGTKDTSNALQFNKNGYLFATRSGGIAYSITIKGTVDKTVSIYGANSAYNDAPSGDALTTLTLLGTSTDATYTFDSDYTFIAIHGAASGTSLVTVTIRWKVEGAEYPLTENPTISPSGSASVSIGKNLPITVTSAVSGQNESDERLVISSDDPTKVTVSGSGKSFFVHGVAETTTPVTVTIGGIKGVYKTTISISVVQGSKTYEDKILTQSGLGITSYDTDTSNNYVDDDVNYTCYNVMNTNGMQFKSGSGYITNKEELYDTGDSANIKSVTLMLHAGQTGTPAVYEGTATNPSDSVSASVTTGNVISYTFSSNMTFFKVASSTGTLQIEKIIVELVDEANSELEEARLAALEILTDLSGLCGDGGSGVVTQSEWNDLNDALEDMNMSANAKYYLKTAPRLLLENLSQGGAEIENAMAHYDACVEKFGYTPFSDITNAHASPRVSPLSLFGNVNTNTVAIIVIISMVSVTAIGGYFFLRKRKENI